MKKDARRSFGGGLPLLLLFLSLLFVQACATTKNSTTNGAETESSAEENPFKQPTMSELILGPGDQIESTVSRQNDLNRKIQIPPDGKISLPWIGELQAAGVSVTQHRGKIAQGLTCNILDPQVSIAVTALKSDKVFVPGEVQRPGIFTLDGRMTALEAVSAAGGFTNDAKWGGVLLIKTRGEKALVTFLDLKKVLKEADPSQNVRLESGDIVYVPTFPIADVSRFMAYVERIIRPIVVLETGIALYPSVYNAFISGNSPQTGRTTTIVVTPSTR